MDLNTKIDNKTARIGIMALGYVGLPLIKAFWSAGFNVIGFDVDQKKIDMLNKGECYLKHFGSDFVREMTETDRFEATSDMDRLGEADVIFVCVPTPLGKHLEPDLSFVAKAAESIAKTLRKGQLISLESTTYPGTTREIMLEPLEATGLKCGEDFYLAYSPEREDPGRKDHSTQTIPKLVGGIDKISGELALKVYQQGIAEVILVSSSEVAEAAKILENVYRAVNIAMVNELKVIFTKMGIDIWEVVDAAKTKPFGFQAFYPGPGLGGHCIPIDPFYLTWKAREYGETTKFIELAGQINHEMPRFVVDRTVYALNQAGKSVKNAKVLILGLAYKPDVDDIRESPSFAIIEQLVAIGADVSYNDPHVPETHAMRKYNLEMKSVELSEATLKTYDCVVVSTNHKAYDWQMIADHANLIVDTRGALRHVNCDSEKLIQA